MPQTPFPDCDNQKYIQVENVAYSSGLLLTENHWVYQDYMKIFFVSVSLITVLPILNLCLKG